MSSSDSIEVFLIPALNDNYVYILRHAGKGRTLVIDPSEATPVLEFLRKKSWNLDFILNTHHHYDHVGGNAELKTKTGCRILTSKYDEKRIAAADGSLSDGAVWEDWGAPIHVLEIPGHTLGHVAFYVPSLPAVFCGDTLFTLGCGRLFEGTAEQMYQSLHRLASLPENTGVYCGHEYTMANARFALTVESTNNVLIERVRSVAIRREQGLPTVPSTIGEELATNPFLRVGREAFAELRLLKDQFR